MKKLLFVPIITAVFFLSSCQKTTTMTDRSTDYIYSLNEEIIIRDIESKGELGTLKITNAVFLKEEPFELPELEEYSEDWTPIYKNVRYEALVQINYIGTAIDSRNKITSDNFSITDSAGESVKFDPVMEYELIETEESTIVVALKNKGDYIKPRCDNEGNM